MEDHLLQRLKAMFLVSCGLGVAAMAGWGGFAYQASSAHRLSDQMASLVAERNAMEAQRDATVHKLDQLEQPPANLTQIEARLKAVGAEYNRLWESAKAQRLKAAKEADSTATGSIQKAQPAKGVR
jgi:hypothetical protein